MGEADLTDDELKEALRSLKPNRSRGYDNISSNVINETPDIFFFPLIRFQFFVTTGNISQKSLKLRRCPQLIRKMKSFYWQITD